MKWTCCFLPTPLGVAGQEVQDPVAQGGVQTQGPELEDELGEYYLCL